MTLFTFLPFSTERLLDLLDFLEVLLDLLGDLGCPLDQIRKDLLSWGMAQSRIDPQLSFRSQYQPLELKNQ